MNRFIALSIGTLALAFAAGAGLKDEKIPLADVPQAARDAINKRFPGAEIRDQVEKETKKASVFYEFELLKDDKKIEAEVGEDGKFREIETKLNADDLPKAVADAIAERFPDAQIRKAEEEIKFRGEVETKTYEVDIVTDGKKIEVKLDADGKILKVDD